MSRIKVFLSDILSPKSAHVNVHLEAPHNRLYVFHLRKEKSPLPHFHMVEVASHPAAFASSIICTRPRVHDVIIQEPTLTHLSIITSGGQTYTLMPHSATGSSRSLNGAKILNIVDSRLALQLSTGSHIRLDFDFNIQHSLTQQCLAALARVLSSRDFFLVKIATLSHYRKNHHARWTLRDFGCVLLSILGLSDSTESAQKHDTHNPWVSMLHDITAKRELYLENALIPEQHPPRSWTERKHTVCDERISRDLAPYVIQALHIVAEDRRLVANRHKDVLALAGVILQLATACHYDAWIDYWMRITPAVQLHAATCSFRKCIAMLEASEAHLHQQTHPLPHLVIWQSLSISLLS